MKYIRLLEYFNGERRSFELPIAPEGTGFQRKVWMALLTITYVKQEHMEI